MLIDDDDIGPAYRLRFDRSDSRYYLDPQPPGPVWKWTQVVQAAWHLTALNLGAPPAALSRLPGPGLPEGCTYWAQAKYWLCRTVGAVKANQLHREALDSLFQSIWLGVRDADRR